MPIISLKIRQCGLRRKKKGIDVNTPNTLQATCTATCMSMAQGRKDKTDITRIQREGTRRVLGQAGIILIAALI